MSITLDLYNYYPARKVTATCRKLIFIYNEQHMPNHMRVYAFMYIYAV